MFVGKKLTKFIFMPKGRGYKKQHRTISGAMHKKMMGGKKMMMDEKRMKKEEKAMMEY
mgnify:CR=1 FL=1